MTLDSLLAKIEKTEQKSMHLPTLDITSDETCIQNIVFYDNQILSLLSTSKEKFRSFDYYVRFKELVRELVLNASEYGNKYDPEKEIIVTLFLGNKGLLIGVRDEGDGVPLELISKVQNFHLSNDFFYNGGKEGRGYYRLTKALDREINCLDFSTDRKEVFIGIIYKNPRT